MGLDMSVYKTKEKIERDVDFMEDIDNDKVEEIFYWRKHPDLHGMMEEIYKQKGGGEKEFNCIPVKLEEADLDKLEFAIKNNALPSTEGFFFGLSDSNEKTIINDLKFIKEARDVLANNESIFYNSWW